MRDRLKRPVAVLVFAVPCYDNSVFWLNKLHFVWTANAAVVVSLIVAVRDRASLRSHWRTAVAWASSLPTVYACFAPYYLGNHTVYEVYAHR